MGKRAANILRTRASHIDAVAQRLEGCQSRHLQQQVLQEAKHLRAIARGMRGDALDEERAGQEWWKREEEKRQAQAEREKGGPVVEKWL